MTPSKKIRATPPVATSAGTRRYDRLLQAGVRRKQAMGDDWSVTASYVREVILPDLDRQIGHAGQWAVAGRVIKGRDSWIFRADSAHAPFPLALKIYCAAVAPEETIRQETLLRRYRDEMAGRPELTVPAPWAVLPDHRTLIMEWIDEPGMDKLLQHTGRRRDERLRLFAAAGRWLRHFHDHSCMAVQPLKPDRLQRRIDHQLGGEHGAGFNVSDPAFRRAYATLVRIGIEFAGAPLPHATAHGDFLAKNLLHGRRGTVGIDISGRSNSPITRDIFHFLVQAEVEKPFLTLAPSGIEGPDAQAFLASYGVIEHLNDRRLIAYFYLAATMTRWANRIKFFRQRRYSFLRMSQALRLWQMARHALSALEPTRPMS